MSIKITKEQARQFAARWALVNAHERKELRATTPQRKFHQLSVLMQSVALFKTDKKRVAENLEVRKQWALLRRRLNG
jgi:hypothetical protein